jgi:hypothetical protein
VREADVPFREAHHITGRAVKLAEEMGCAGQTPPPVGRGADHVEAPGELTRFEKQARPDRAGEPLYRSEERKDDKFDLPPS